MSKEYLGLPIEVDPTMPEGEIRIKDSRTGELLGRIYNIGGRPTADYDATLSLMKDKFPKAIEPAGIDKFRPRDKWLPSDGHSMLDAYPLTPDECDPAVSPLMRRLGFNTNPATCTHYRKRMYAGMAYFICADCGTENV